MRPTRGALVTVAVAVAVAHGAHAFVQPSCALAWRTTSAAAATAHTTQSRNRPHTCSVVDNRRLRPATMRVSNSEDADISASAVDALVMEEERTGEGQPGLRWAGVRRSLARGAASVAAFTFGATALSGLSAEVQHRVGGGVSMPAAMESAQASIFRPFAKRTVEEKLSNIPAFMITNVKGSPYLTPTTEDGHQVGGVGRGIAQGGGVENHVGCMLG